MHPAITWVLSRSNRVTMPLPWTISAINLLHAALAQMLEWQQRQSNRYTECMGDLRMAGYITWKLFANARGGVADGVVTNLRQAVTLDPSIKAYALKDADYWNLRLTMLLSKSCSNLFNIYKKTPCDPHGFFICLQNASGRFFRLIQHIKAGKQNCLPR